MSKSTVLWFHNAKSSKVEAAVWGLPVVLVLVEVFDEFDDVVGVDQFEDGVLGGKILCLLC